MADKIVREPGSSEALPRRWRDNGDGTYSPEVYNTAPGGAGGDGAIQDGVTSTIEATVFDRTNSNPLAVQTVDSNGDPVSAGGTTQYAEDTPATAGEQVVMIGTVRKDVGGTLVDTDGDRAELQVDASGNLRVAQQGNVNVGNFPAVQPVSDNGGSLTVDGSVGITGAVDTELPAAAALADNMANPTVPQVGAHALVWDGVTWDRETQPLTDAQLRATAVPVSLSEPISVDDNGGSLTVDGSVSLAAAVPAGTNNIGDVDVLTLPALPAGTNNIGDVDIASFPAAALEVIGDVAADLAVPANPVIQGGRASNVPPTAVSADGDAVHLWLTREGAQIVSIAPHIALDGTPFDQTHEAAQYTATQTSTALVLGGASEKLVVTDVQIQAFGTTAFDLQLYFGTGAFVRGTNRAIFDGTFKPSSTSAPGAILKGPFISGTLGDDLLVTTSAAGSVTINVWYYVIT